MPIDIINLMLPSAHLQQESGSYISLLLHLTPPSPRASRPNPLVQTDSHGIHWTDLAVKCGLEVTMRTQALFDETTSSALSPQRQALEPFDICVVEEHVAYGDDTLVDLVGVTSQDDALGYDAVCRGRKRCSCCD